MKIKEKLSKIVHEAIANYDFEEAIDNALDEIDIDEIISTKLEKKIEEMKMCVKLLDIIFEDDAPSRMYWDAYSKIQLFTVAPPDKDGLSELIPTGEKPPKFPVHINTKNGKRFNKYWDENLEPIIQPELRRVKALHLYNKLRNRCFGWWW